MMNHIEIIRKKKHSTIAYAVGIIILSFILQSVFMIIEIPFIGKYNPEMLKFILTSGKEKYTIIQTWDKNAMFFAMALPIVLTFFVTRYLIRKIMRLRFSQVVNGTSKIRKNRILMGFIVWFVIMSITLLGEFIFSPETLIFQFNLKSFIVLFILSCILIPIQTTYEEMIFRGILTQTVGKATRSRILAIIIPSLCFMAVHWINPEMIKNDFWLMSSIYLVMGLLLGFTTILDDGMELAIGIHAANNLFLSLFLTQNNSALKTDAVFESTANETIYSLLILIFLSIVVLYLFTYQYKWNWNKLFIKISNYNVQNDIKF